MGSNGWWHHTILFWSNTEEYKLNVADTYVNTMYVCMYVVIPHPLKKEFSSSYSNFMKEDNG